MDENRVRFRINAVIDLDDISVDGDTEDGAFAVIKMIDLRQASYDFTKRCLDHFAAEIAKEDALSEQQP